MPNMRRVRYRPLADIVSDVKTNVQNGQHDICLHAEDALRFGTYNLMPDHEKVVQLFQTVKNVEGVNDICISHASLASIASSPQTISSLKEVLGLGEHRWLGFQTGIETGSPSLIESLMSRKAAPFKPSEWGHVVETAFAVCHDNNWVPAATLVVNLPGETESDVVQTTALVEALRDYRSIIIPLLFVPFGDSTQRPMRMMEDAREYHCDLYKAIWLHDMHWVQVLLDDYVRNNSIATKIFLNTIAGLVQHVASPIAISRLDKRAKKAKEESDLIKNKSQQSAYEQLLMRLFSPHR
jgi:radical SAM superfamily enzyme YgiQ (UPF0313 family)